MDEETAPVIRAKFSVAEIVVHGAADDKTASRTVKLSAIFDTSIEEDLRFSQATPTGSIEMRIDNPAAADKFVLGKSYYADFTPVDQSNDGVR